MEKEQLYEIIEQYLDGTLSGEALAAFEERLRTEPELAKEVTLHRKLQEELGNAQKRQLRDKLDALRGEFTESEEEAKFVPINQSRRLRLIISMAASILVLVFAIWFFFFKTPEKQEIVDEEPPTEKQENAPQDEDKIKEIEDPSNLVEDNSTPQKEQKENNKTEDKTPPKNLMANFEPNPELEQLIAQNDAQKDFDFSAEMPSTGKPFVLKNGKIDLQINGMLFASEIKDENNFTVEIYDNDPQHYKMKKRVATFQLSVEKDTAAEDDGLAFATKEAYFYRLEKSLASAPGLYYYLIYQKGQTNPLFTGKFQVNE